MKRTQKSNCQFELIPLPKLLNTKYNGRLGENEQRTWPKRVGNGSCHISKERFIKETQK
jgi:hypothetical protein